MEVFDGTGSPAMSGPAGSSLREKVALAGLSAASKPRVLLMGPRRGGKSSIQKVVFQKMSPHETLFLESTTSLDIKYVANNALVQFQIWDFPGDYDCKENVVYGDQTLTEADFFKERCAVVYVIDAQDEPYTEALENFLETAQRVHRINPKVSFEVFIHKVDGDLFSLDDQKMECQSAIEQQISKELEEAGIDLNVSFFLTSIYDHSIFEAFSRVIQKLVPQIPVLENLLNALIGSCGIEKAFLFDVVSKIYIATDSNPVDAQSYELCSDMIDVVIDVSCIYGVREEGDGYAYDSSSASVIRLAGGPYSGMVLYLREVSSYLALVCLIKEDNFTKQGLIDFNISTFKTALNGVMNVSKGPAAAAAGAADGSAAAGSSVAAGGSAVRPSDVRVSTR